MAYAVDVDSPYKAGTVVRPKKKKTAQQAANQQVAAAPAQAVSETAAVKPFEERMQEWMQQYGGKLQEALAASQAAKQATSRVSRAVKIPSLPSATYNPYTDPRFATMLKQLEEAVSSPFQPNLEETPQYQAAQAALQRQAEEQAKRAVQQMAARNILRSSMTEQAYEDIAEGVTEALQTQVAPQVYQQLLGERQQQIQNMVAQLQAALAAAGFGAEEQARAFNQAMARAQLQASIRQADLAQQLEEAGITGYYGGQPTLGRQATEAGLLGTYLGQPTLAARSLEQQKWEALLPWTQGLTPYQRAQIGLQQQSLALQRQVAAEEPLTPWQQYQIAQTGAEVFRNEMSGLAGFKAQGKTREEALAEFERSLPYYQTLRMPQSMIDAIRGEIDRLWPPPAPQTSAPTKAGGQRGSVMSFYLRGR